jgi:hypothetical protein
MRKEIMTINHTARALVGVCLMATSALHAAPAHAAASDYRFEIVEVTPAAPGKSNVTLRLTHTPDKKPVTGAVLFQIAVDMGPDGMPTMTAPVKALPASKPGLYTVEIEPGMVGNWSLQVAAKVQGESDTVRAALPLKLGK